MKLFRKQNKPSSISEIFEKHIVNNEVLFPNDFIFLYELVAYFRPEKPTKIKSITLIDLVAFFIENENYRIIFSEYIKNLLKDRSFSRLISDAGIIQDSDFIYEIRKRISLKILPYQPEKETLEYVLNQVFYKETDFIWINKIPFIELVELFEVLQFSDVFTSHKEEKGALSEVMYALGIITQRMSGRAMETNIIRMVPEYNHLESPFLGLENEFLEIEKHLRNRDIIYVEPNDLNYKQLIILHKQCVEFVKQAFKNSSKYGITMKVNQSLLRIRQQLARVEILLSLFVVRESQDKTVQSINLALKLIEYNCYKNNIKKLIGESTQLISYEITQHTAKTGEHYITESSNEYLKMFKGAMGGGLIVGFLCVIKVLMSKADTSDFGFAFIYSLNYSIGFTLIYLFGFTLATKQPAMTASTLIKVIEEGLKSNEKASEKHKAFAHLFARLFRSQFIAFVGNVILAFPVALLLIWLIDLSTGINITDTKWHTLLDDISPIKSAAIFHACIAGVFLFLSGIISGNVSNKNKHNQVYYRIQENPFLKRTLGISKTAKLAGWLEEKWPGIVSNLWFGVFMGSTHSIGMFLGLNLDIRHITFASGNIALGAYGADFAITLSTWLWCLIGLVLIGFFNFIVSFALSLGLALRSRDIPIFEVFSLQKSVWSHFKQYPTHFFFPPRK